jgi:hypothetical protein
VRGPFLYFSLLICYIAGMRCRSPGIYAVLYVALGCVFVYGVWNTREGFGESTAAATLIVVLAIGVHVGFGFAIGKWWALLLPFALALLAVPAGFPPTGDREPLPIWLVQIYLGIAEALLMVPGILTHKLRSRDVLPGEL